ncbi:hypothetical protein SALBM311S_04920 [Streptomyces alboniger]
MVVPCSAALPPRAPPDARAAPRPHTAILAATRQALVDLGWSELTLCATSRVRAGVAKTTLYRRWAGKNELVVDAVAELFDELTLPDRGSRWPPTSRAWSCSSRRSWTDRRRAAA